MAIGQKVFSSLRWMAVGRFSAQIIIWAVTIMVMRILSPEDYGLMAMTMVTIGFLALFEELGLGAALVQARELPEQMASAIFALLLLLNLVLYAVLYLLAPLVALFFGEAALTDLLRVASLGLLVQAFGVVPDALLSRAMNFRSKSIVLFIAMVSGSFTTLALAWSGFGVWSLVAGNLLTAVVRVVGLTAASGFAIRPRLVRFPGLGAAIRFGGLITFDRLLSYFYRQADVLIIGKVLGKELLGFYSVAMHLASLPMQKFAGMMNEVGFSAFSRVQDDQQVLSRSMYKSARLLALVAFPVFFGIASVAPEIVQLLLTDKWRPAIIPIQLLSIAVPLRLMVSVLPSALYGTGKAGISVGNTVIACLLLPAGFVIGVQYGITGVCLVWIFVFPVFALAALSRTLRALGLSVRTYLRGIVGPALSASVMLVSLFAMRKWLLPAEINELLQLLLICISGVTIYTAAMLVAFRPAAQEFVGILSKRAGSAGPPS